MSYYKTVDISIPSEKLLVSAKECSIIMAQWLLLTLFANFVFLSLVWPYEYVWKLYQFCKYSEFQLTELFQERSVGSYEVHNI